MSEVQLQQVKDRESLKKYLLLADEDEKIVEGYLNEGMMYAITVNQEVAGVCLFIEIEDETIELKNLALDKRYRRKGIGKKTLEIATEIHHRSYTYMEVGTANCSLDNIAFYQKAGFRFHKIKKDFFLRYPSPIVEFGIQALDMVVFRKKIKE
ncbi:GNAT family N-acetyltransferase [Halobacillus yeomjeoni]|uniref:GNAT family N-acetyltransferase n=1 Tax=Halobacillus yeomjeoni TaxID=311194 RepID=UPI001CD342CF|nr:GNAT family N-acetyltransferase [Halobacillus yeomjeoni]MCA0984749.1 GNAT family N-acetyltransferase [Halobacillus yeomjeoni]